MIGDLFQKWVDTTQRQIDPRPAALVRILVATSVFLDQVWVWAIGLVPWLYRPFPQGGLGTTQAPYYVLDDLFGPVMAGTHAWALTVVGMLCVAIGFRSRLMTIIAVVFYAQLLLGFWQTWHGGGKIAREVLLILLFAPAVHQVWAIDGPKDPPKTMKAWPVDMIRLLFVFIYLGAGWSKLFPDPSLWMSPYTGSECYRIMTNPHTSYLDAEFWAPLETNVFYVFDVATVIIELMAPLAMTKWRPYWAIFAAPLHIGIAVVMQLWAFSFIMLAVYPLFFDEWIVAWLNRNEDKIAAWKARISELLPSWPARASSSEQA